MTCRFCLDDSKDEFCSTECEAYFDLVHVTFKDDEDADVDSEC